jgi:CRP/FNR family transcriptional regulator
VIACFIDINAFKKFIFKNGKFAYEIILDLCRYELHNFHNCVNKVQKQLNGRIADALIYLADEIFESENFEMVLSRNELADLVGSSRESVSRVLNQFQEDNIIQMEGKSIHLVNRNSLEVISRNG